MIKRILASVLTVMMIIPLILIGGTSALAETPALTAGAIFVAPGGTQSGPGTIEAPFQTIAQGLDALAPGGTLYIREGVYTANITIPPSLSGNSVMANCTNTFDYDTRGCICGRLPNEVANCTLNEIGNTVISAFPGETPIIRIPPAASGSAINFMHVQNITINGLTVEGGANGISNQAGAGRPADGMENIYITNNTVRYAGRGGGGNSIRVYNQTNNATNSSSIRNLVISGNHVHDGRSGSTETIVTNGNITGIMAFDNVIHNNNNIAIDFIGYEGSGSNTEAFFSHNRARNVLVFNNVIFGTKTINGASAYRITGGTRPAPLGNYDPCSVGIYIDGGTKIRIFYNLLFDNDIGVEIACERATTGASTLPFTKTDVHLHDNIITHSYGEGGIAIGGYNSHRTTSWGLIIENNILYSNRTEFLIQKARDNYIRDNIIVSEQAPYGRVLTDGRWSPWPGANFNSTDRHPQNVFTIEDLRNQPALDFWGTNLWYTNNPAGFAEGNYGPDPRSFGANNIALGYWDGNLIYNQDGELVSLGNGTYIWNDNSAVLSHVELSRLAGGIIKGMRELASGVRNPNASQAILDKAAENLARQIILDVNPLVDPNNGNFSMKPEFAALYPNLGTDPANWTRQISQKYFGWYNEFTDAKYEVFAATDFLESTKFDFMDAGDNLADFLTAKLKEAGFANTEVLFTIAAATDNAFGRPFQDTMAASTANGGLDGFTGNAIVTHGGEGAVNVPWQRPDNGGSGWTNGNISSASRNVWNDNLEAGRVKEFAYKVMVITRFGDQLCPTSGKQVAYTATGTYSYDGGVRMFISNVDFTVGEALLAQLDELNLQASRYTDESWADLQEAISVLSGELAIAWNTQAKLDTAAAALEKALEALELRPPTVVSVTAPALLNAALAEGDVNLTTPGSGGFGISATNSITVPAGSTLYVSTILNVRRDATLIIEGTVVVLEGGRINNDGGSAGGGTIVIAEGGSLVNYGRIESVSNSSIFNYGTITNNGGETGDPGRFEIRENTTFINNGTVDGTRPLNINRNAILELQA